MRPPIDPHARMGGVACTLIPSEIALGICISCECTASKRLIMNKLFARHSIAVGILLAFPIGSTMVFAAEPYPALPPSLSTSVTPNVILYLDTSGSMLQDTNNQWMLTGLCDSNANWSACVNNNTRGYRDAIDSEVTSPNTKMNIAKRVARNLIDNNRKLRFGLFYFEDYRN
jgi:type IV pilus assembly protein PilY1